MRNHLDLSRLQVDSEHIVSGVIRHEHAAPPIKHNPVADASFWKLNEQLRFALGRDSSNRSLLREIHYERIPVAIACRSFNSFGEQPGLRERFRFELFFLCLLKVRTSDREKNSKECNSP